MAEKTSFFQKLKNGLKKTRLNVVSGMESLFMGVSSIDEDFYEELEETLIMGDVGVQTTEKLIEDLRTEVEARHLIHPRDCRGIILDLLKDQMKTPEDAYDFEKEPSIIFVTGVNGVGKTTSIGKLAYKYRREGRKVLVAACDTFRAAASDQLAIWCERAGVPMIASESGRDPSSVLFNALTAARSRGTDMLICDTAGRLHNKRNLMEELSKMNRVIEREGQGFLRENLLVLDATTGQNAVQQAKEFVRTSDLTGIILTKMDGTAKGGMAISVENELGLPVKFIGVGEGIDDLEKFSAKDFIDALFEENA